MSTRRATGFVRIKLKKVLVKRANYLAFYILCFFSVSIFLTFLFISLPVRAQTQTAPFEFNIRPQYLNDALVQFSAITGVQFIYIEDGVLDVETKGLIGRASVLDGLSSLLADTGYMHQFSNPDTVRIFKVDTAELQKNIASGSNDIAPDSNVQSEAELILQAAVQEDSALQRRIIPKEIIVTARMREEYIQDVPISISTFDSTAIEQRSIVNVLDLNVLLPNVNIRGGGTSGPSSGQFVIRGIPGVARYIDGVPQQAPQGALFNILELERIEVLRGPQGTLFGKNALSGAIQYITRNPGDEFAVRLKATAGSMNRRDLIANIDLPLSDTVLTKITVASLNRDGFVNTAVPGFKHGNINNDILRGQILWIPTDNFDANWTVEFNKVQQN